jgi:5-methylcytosine-specific restriction endonuclease McrA
MPSYINSLDFSGFQIARIPRKEALRRGLKRYFTGEPCVHGHVSERKVHSWACCECARIDRNLRVYPGFGGECPPSKKAPSIGGVDGVKASRRRYQEGNRERYREQSRRWAKENPEKNRAKGNRRRARKSGSSGTYSKDDIDQLMIMQFGLCGNHKCRTDLKVSKFHVDHIVPLHRGGSNWPDNLQLLCPFCNGSKGHKLPEEWGG